MYVGHTANIKSNVTIDSDLAESRTKSRKSHGVSSSGLPGYSVMLIGFLLAAIELGVK